MLVSGISNKNAKTIGKSQDSEKSWQVPGTRTNRITEKKTARVATTYSEDPKSFNISKAQMKHVDVSENSGTPKSSILIGFFHYKPSILGYPYFWKHPCHITSFAYAVPWQPHHGSDQNQQFWNMVQQPEGNKPIMDIKTLEDYTPGTWEYTTPLEVRKIILNQFTSFSFELLINLRGFFNGHGEIYDNFHRFKPTKPRGTSSSSDVSPTPGDACDADDPQEADQANQPRAVGPSSIAARLGSSLEAAEKNSADVLRLPKIQVGASFCLLRHFLLQKKYLKKVASQIPSEPDRP